MARPPFATPDPSLLQDAEQFQRIVGDVKDYAIFLLDAHGYVATWRLRHGPEDPGGSLGAGNDARRGHQLGTGRG